jgi:hypothetical protein
MKSGGLSVKRLWLVFALVLMISSTGYAAQGVSISGGVTKGTLIDVFTTGNWQESTNLGYYVTAAGAYQIGSVPLAFTGSYSSFSAETLTLNIVEVLSGTLNHYNSSSLFRLFVGYSLPNTPVSLGGGLVHHRTYLDSNYPNEPVWVSYRFTGLALTAFGAIPVSEKAQIGAQLFYVPVLGVKRVDSSTVEGANGLRTGYGFEIDGSYQVLPTLALEVGYQSFTAKYSWSVDAEHETVTTSSLFAGVKLAL